MRFNLSRHVWEEKYAIITDVYGFGSGSWEASATPRDEAFWVPSSSEQAMAWPKEGRRSRENPGAYDYPPPPGGLATQGDLLFKGLQAIGVEVHAVHLESVLENRR